MVELLAIGLGVLVGLTLGLTGAGGSMLAVPLLMAGLGWSLPQAAPVGLLAVAASASVGTLMAWRHGLVRWRAALLMASLGWLTAPLGLRLAQQLTTGWLMALFAGVVGLAAWRLLHQAQRDPLEDGVLQAATSGVRESAHTPVCPTDPHTGRIRWNQRCAWVLATVGALSGLLSGLIGVGGGFVIVPALRSMSALTMHSAAATSLMAVALISGGALLAGVLHGQGMPLGVAAPFIAGALGGMFVGRYFAMRIAGPPLQRGFAALMAGIAVWMAWRAAMALI